MFQKLVKSFVIVCTLVLALSTVVFADSMSSMPAQADDLKVSLTFDKTPVKTGENDFTVKIENNSQQPVAGAEVKATFDMNRSNMDKMSMKDPIVVTLTEDKPGQYSGSVNLANKGDWMATVDLNASGQKSTSQIDFTVESAGPNMFVIGGFIGAIALIIVIALIVKRRNSLKA